MLRFLKHHSALTLFLLAVALGVLPIALVAAGLLPPGFNQLGALSASLAGIILAAAWGGRAGVRKLLGRALIWRVGSGWWLFVLLFPALPTLAALYLPGVWGGPPGSLTSVGSPLRLVVLMIFLFVFAGLGEEFGWRGFALPRVQARHNALVASLIVGLLHGLWHTPLFFIKGVNQYDLAQQIGVLPAMLCYTLFVMALAVQMTWIFNSTGGSVLLVAAYHGSLNAWNGYIDIYRGRMDGIWASAGLMTLVSLGIVIVYGTENLTRTGTRVQVDS